MTKRKPPAVPRQGYHQDRTKREWLPFAARGFSKPARATRDELRSIAERERILKDAPHIAASAIARGWAIMPGCNATEPAHSQAATR